MKNLNPLYCLNESAVVGGAIGAGIGSLAGSGVYALGEWYAHFLKELIIVIRNAENPFEVKKWFNENIIQNNDIFTRRHFLKPGMDSHGYVDKNTGLMTSTQRRNLGMRINDAINSVMDNNTQNWKEVLLKFCKKELLLYRVANGIGAAGLTIGGAALGAALGQNSN